MSAITSSGEDSIKRDLHVKPLALNIHQEEDYITHFEIDKCVNWIKENTFQRVALQIPDDLLHVSVPVYNAISSQIDSSSSVYILADSTYGSCCIDEKTAAHINADSLIHFGHSCGSSRKTQLPVLYVHVRPDINENQLVNDFQSTYSDTNTPVGILYDSEYEDIAKQLRIKLMDNGYVNISLVDGTFFENIEDSSSSSCVSNEENKEVVVKEQEKIVVPQRIFYLTSTERSIINRILQVNHYFSSRINTSTNSDSDNVTDPINPEVSIYNPSTSSPIQTPSIHKLLMKRNYYIEKVREASTIGILVGTLSVDNYIQVIRHLQTILKKAGKTGYVVSIGEISAPKLANFPDINAFVLVACPEATLIESKEFYQVVVTPWEVEVAFGRQNNNADYFVDYRVLLPGSREHIPFEKYSANGEGFSCLDVSLLNGVSRIGLNWQGLEEKLPVSDDTFKIHQGQSGIANHYTSEPQVN